MKSYWYLLSHLGMGWAVFRVRYILLRRSGALRRATPATGWDSLPEPTLRLSTREHPSRQAWVGKDSIGEADAILEGRFKLFSGKEVQAGRLPNWFRNQLTGEQVPSKQHWSQLGDFAFGDIKGVWELNRFTWAFTLARARARSGEERYGKAFWTLFNDWCLNNPPNLGPNWMCGQEATFRLQAVVFAAEECGVPESMRAQLARFVLTTGRRIAANLDYALSQKNNHGISECVGLITAALLIPERPESQGWRARGERALKSQLHELVYGDGAFSQHSLIYHRVLMHDLAWLAARFNAVDEPPAEWLTTAAERAHAFVGAIIDPLTGQAPLFGTNDGANVLPISDGDFLDMRPMLRSVEGAFGWASKLPAGAWDEAGVWMGADLAVKKDKGEMVPLRGGKRFGRGAVTLNGQEGTLWHAPEGGYFDWQKGDGDRVFLRCPTRFRHRPSQADMLHLDVWLAGRQVACDGGSFSYNSTERFVGLSKAAHHNVLTVDGIEPLRKFSRFLYLPWPRGKAGPTDDGLGWSASHHGYASLGVEWTREVYATVSGWRVVDRVCSKTARKARWHWLLADADWILNGANCRSAFGLISWSGVAGVQAKILRADATTAYGWRSTRYGEVEPAVSLILEAAKGTAIELSIEFSFSDASLSSASQVGN